MAVNQNFPQVIQYMLFGHVCSLCMPLSIGVDCRAIIAPMSPQHCRSRVAAGHLEGSSGGPKSAIQEAVKAAKSAGITVSALSKHDLNMLSDNRPHQVTPSRLHLMSAAGEAPLPVDGPSLMISDARRITLCSARGIRRADLLPVSVAGAECAMGRLSLLQTLSSVVPTLCAGSGAGCIRPGVGRTRPLARCNTDIGSWRSAFRVACARRSAGPGASLPAGPWFS
jgi:hypothetical protein